jgi:hypothetical protein
MLTAILAALASAGSAIGSAAGATAGAVGSAAGAAGSAIGSAAGAIGSGIGEAAGAVGSALGEAGSTVGGWLGEAGQALGVGGGGSGPSTGSYLSGLRSELVGAGHSPGLASNPAQAATAIQNPTMLSQAFGQTGVGGVMQNPRDPSSWMKLAKGAMGGRGQQPQEVPPPPGLMPYEAPRLGGLRPAIPRGAVLELMRRRRMGGLYG